MRRDLLAVLFLASSTVLCGAPRAQEVTREQFRGEFSKGVEYADEKMIDKAVKKSPAHGVQYFEELYFDKLAGKTDVVPKLDAMQASWHRSFEGNRTLEKMQRWLDGSDRGTYDALQKLRANAVKVYNFHTGLSQPTDTEHRNTMRQFVELARSAQSLGHAIEAADLLLLGATVGGKLKDKNLDDRKEVVAVTREFLEQRRTWDFTVDNQFLAMTNYVKDEDVRIAEAEKAGQKRQAEGYDPNAKGIDSLIVAGAKDDAHALQYEALATWDDLDYGPRNGPVPAFWWSVSTGKEGSAAELAWFRARKIWLARTGASKFAISLDATDHKKAAEVDVASKPKASTFWLDADKKVPYSMFFWAGGDREKVGEAEVNLMSTTDLANVFYRSAASWKTTVGAEALCFYDDNASGAPCDFDPFEPPFKMHSLGDHAGDGTLAPLFDSLRIGKGPRMPYSEFVKLAGGWFHLRKTKAEEVALRPLNPEYFKTGKVKLVWNGPKPTAPAQLVIQGRGDYKTAFFDLAGGKEVEVPAGSWSVVWGRLAIGKGPRAQLAQIHPGKAQPFIVEPGKTFELKMGAPFAIQWTRRGDENATIDALQVLLAEASGCVLTELHGMALAPEVWAAKADDGKGAKPAGKFVLFTDGELINEASKKHNNLGRNCACFPMPEGYRNGELVLKVKLPAPGMKLQLRMPKHPVFGALLSAWQ